MSGVSKTHHNYQAAPLMHVDEENPAPSLRPCPAASEPPPAPPPKAVRRKPWRIVAMGIAVLVALAFAIPWLLHSLNTVSTDDAYVNRHVTFL